MIVFGGEIMNNNLPEGWRRLKLKDITKRIVGGSTPSTKDPENYGGDIPWITVKDLSQHKFRYIYRGERNITKKGLKEIGNKLIPKGSVLISSRAPIGYVAIAGTDLTTNQGIRSLILKEDFDPEFVYYLIKANVHVLKAYASGTTFKEISGSTLGELEFNFPPLPEQHKIAEILGSLDDKIELNIEMNKTLEEIAKAIFKYYFVDFEPFKDDLVYNEELGKEIPRGWEVVELGDVVTAIKGLSYKSEYLAKESDVGLVNLKCIAPGGGFREYGIKPYVGEFKREHVLHEGDIVIAITDLTQNKEVIGMPAWVYPIDGYKTLVASLDLLILRPKNNRIRKSFLYYLLLTPHYKGYVNGCADGTTVRHLKPTDVLRYTLALPPEEYQKKFAKIADNLIGLMIKNRKENRILSQIRDALLPKLLSGEIRVNVDEVEDIIKEELPEKAEKLEEVRKEKEKQQKNIRKVQKSILEILKEVEGTKH